MEEKAAKKQKVKGAKKILTVEQIRVLLEDRRLTYVSKHCGVTYMSLSRIVRGKGKPRAATLEKLTDYFEKRP